MTIKIFSLASLTIPFLIGSINFFSCQKRISLVVNEPLIAIGEQDTTTMLAQDSVTLDANFKNSTVYDK